MSPIEYHSGSFPSTEQFRKELRESSEQYDPVDKLLALQRELIELEAKYGISSAEAFQKFQNGEAGDDRERMWWAGRYRQYIQLKAMLSESLQLIVSSPSADPIPL